MNPAQTRLEQIYAALNEYSTERDLHVEKFTVESLIASHRRLVEHAERYRSMWLESQSRTDAEISRRAAAMWQAEHDANPQLISVAQLRKMTLAQVADLITTVDITD